MATTGGAWLPKAATHRPQSWFTVDRDTRSELRLRNLAATDGEALQPFGWVRHIHRARSGYIARGGLHRVLAWPFLFKNYSVRDLAEFLEVYGLPVGLGKYQPGASDEEKATLLKALLAIGHSARGIIPDGMSIEFLQAAQGQSDPFVVMIQWCESSVSKAILGGTLTSQTSANGNRALGEVHNEVRNEIRNHDALQIASTLTRDLVYPLAVLNTQGVADPRRGARLVFDTGDAEDLALYADSLPRLVDYGARVPVRWVHEKLRIPEPEGEEAILRPARGQGPGAGGQNESEPSPSGTNPPGVDLVERSSPEGFRAGLPGNTGQGEGSGEAAATAQQCPHCTAALSAGDSPDADPTPVTAYAQQLAERGQAPLKDWLEIIRARVDGAESLEALRDDLLGMFGDLPAEELAKVMETAFACADLAGRFEVRQESPLPTGEG